MPRKKNTQLTFLSKYSQQRDQFFKKHQYSRIIIGFLIIAFAFFLGMQYRNFRATQYVFLQLFDDGLPLETIHLR